MPLALHHATAVSAQWPRMSLIVQAPAEGLPAMRHSTVATSARVMARFGSKYPV